MIATLNQVTHTFAVEGVEPVYEYHQAERAAGGRYALRVAPATVEITWHHRFRNGSTGARWYAGVIGQRIRKDGGLGAIGVRAGYSQAYGDGEMPEWLRALVEQTRPDR